MAIFYGHSYMKTKGVYMNKLTKAGLTALAGSLAAYSANAADFGVSGSVNMTYVSDTGVSGNPYGLDSRLTFATSGDVNGYGVSYYTTMESHYTGSNQYSGELSVDMGDLGKIALQQGVGNGGIDQIDDETPKAYEEVWDTTTGGDVRIDGRSGNNLLTYDSPSFNGVMFKMAHQVDHETTAATNQNYDLGQYTDFGIQISPEMVEGLTVGYATAELEDTTSTSIDNETFFVKYAVGGFTLGYQTHEADSSVAADNDESTSWGISYAVNENMTIAYGERDYDDDTSTAGSSSSEQHDSGFSASYTMGGMTIAGHMNTNDNVGGSTAATNDKESYEFALTFAF